jgi:hypothetical protein
MALFTDDFARGDTAADLGANYTDCLGAGLGIISGRAYNSDGASSRGSFLTGTTQTDDQYAQAVITGLGSSYYTILLRGNGADATRDCYQVTAGGTNELYITRIVDGANVSEVSGTFTLVEGMVLRGEAEGTTIRLKLDGTERLSKTDSALTTGFTGLEQYNPVSARFDDFEAGDIGGGGSSILQQMLAHH